MVIIEIELSFNFRVVLLIFVFGLMQLVLKIVGLDVYLFVYGEKKIVSVDYLFNEENNFKFGLVYFYLLMYCYLCKISDLMVWFYCVVVSYNMGVGNVVKIFIGKKSISVVVKVIN